MMRFDEMGNQIGDVLSVPRDMRDGRTRSASPSLPDGQSATPARTDVDPLTQLARLIAQDEAFRGIPRNEGRSAPELSVHASPGLARENTRPEHGWGGEYEEPDVPGGLPNRRRGRSVFITLIGLVLAGAASGAAYWLWSGRLVSFNKAATIAVATVPNKTVPAPPGEESRSDARLDGQSDERSVKGADRVLPGEEKLPDADLAAAAPQAVPPAGVLYGPAAPQAAELTSAAVAPGGPAAPAANPPPQSNDTAATQTAPEAANPGLAHEAKYVVQLSSQRSEAAAQTTSKLLQTKYAELFAGRQPFIRRSDLGERGVYYRVLIGPLPTTGEANQLCGNLKKSGADCVVQKN
jgi:hypothetical protein